MSEDSASEAGYAAYLLELHRQLESLQRFPPSSYSQALILAISTPLLLTGVLGFAVVPVPGYLLLPFVVLPAWTLIRRERAWRVERRLIKKRIRVIEEKRGPC